MQVTSLMETRLLGDSDDILVSSFDVMLTHCGLEVVPHPSWESVFGVSGIGAKDERNLETMCHCSLCGDVMKIIREVDVIILDKYYGLRGCGTKFRDRYSGMACIQLFQYEDIRHWLFKPEVLLGIAGVMASSLKQTKDRLVTLSDESQNLLYRSSIETFATNMVAGLRGLNLQCDADGGRLA
jgi:hypothetical protein